ncbi:hypothetical protein ACFFX0_22780 [Citricoccus parietis]|uniref:Uncharacterized protein n=1 Tax=Citricoccus parietis TaxID=592307 RepID=A0ABV5G4K3_9MICC
MFRLYRRNGVRSIGRDPDRLDARPLHQGAGATSAPPPSLAGPRPPSPPASPQREAPGLREVGGQTADCWSAPPPTVCLSGRAHRWGRLGPQGSAARTPAARNTDFVRPRLSPSPGTDRPRSTAVASQAGHARSTRRPRDPRRRRQPAHRLGRPRGRATHRQQRWRDLPQRPRQARTHRQKGPRTIGGCRTRRRAGQTGRA